MALAGKLSTMHLAEILQWCKNGGKTGNLSFERRGISKRIFFEKGSIISAASTEPSEYLGSFLVSLGRISEDQLQLGFDIQRDGIAGLHRCALAQHRRQSGQADAAKLIRGWVAGHHISEPRLLGDAQRGLFIQRVLRGRLHWPVGDTRDQQHDQS